MVWFIFSTRAFKHCPVEIFDHTVSCTIRWMAEEEENGFLSLVRNSEGGILPSIGMRDGRVDENKTNWLHSFFFFARYF